MEQILYKGLVSSCQTTAGLVNLRIFKEKVVNLWKLMAHMDSRQQLKEQWELLQKYAEEHADEDGVRIEYLDAYGKYPCLQVTIDHFLFDMDYRSQEDVSKNEIRTRLYFLYTDKIGCERLRSFMIKRGSAPSEYGVFARVRADYHFLPVTYSTWANEMIGAVKSIRRDNHCFLQMCRASCPFNADGSHKFKSWRNYAKVEIVREGDNPLVQGVKGGNTPSGAHVVGGNGSFRVFNRGDYGLQYTVERLAGEKPVRGCPTFVSFDEYLRALRDKLGYSRNMPRDLLNSKLPERLEVITYDMSKEPEDRDFVPVEYGGSWLKFLQECFKDL